MAWTWPCSATTATKSSPCSTAAHKGGPLSQGIVFGTRVACPMHNWTIGLDSGCAKEPDEGCTPRFAVKVQDGVVHLDAHELATQATDLTRPIAGPLRRAVPA